MPHKTCLLTIEIFVIRTFVVRTKVIFTAPAIHNCFTWVVLTNLCTFAFRPVWPDWAILECFDLGDNIFTKETKRSLSTFWVVRAVFVSQLVEKSFPTPEIGGSNPIIIKFYLLSTYYKLYWKDEKIKKPRNFLGYYEKVTF